MVVLKALPTTNLHEVEDDVDADRLAEANAVVLDDAVQDAALRREQQSQRGSASKTRNDSL